ncbi:hypothetical protein Btru_046445 [Bulinus truncatus]|nr:hypothetical protein Btru_046445 [Bulinus truncatus]
MIKTMSQQRKHLKSMIQTMSQVMIFQNDFLRRKLPTGEIRNRSRLLFSPHLECLFCFACVLFSEAPEKTSSALSKKKPERLKENDEGFHQRQAFLKMKLEEEKA